MRTIHELLIILLEKFKEERPDGLCNSLGTLHLEDKINRFEFRLLNDYMSKHKPLIGKIRSIAFYSLYWWKPYNTAARIKWLKKHIKKQTLDI